jgi:hypothetical protein
MIGRHRPALAATMAALYSVLLKKFAFVGCFHAAANTAMATTRHNFVNDLIFVNKNSTDLKLGCTNRVRCCDENTKKK